MSIPQGSFGPAKCAFCLVQPWAKWCRWCNLVFCETDAPPERHECKRWKEAQEKSLEPAMPAREKRGRK